MKFLSGLEVTDDFALVRSENGLTGWIRKDLPGDLFRNLIPDPDRFFSDPSAQILKNESKVQVIKQTLKGRDGVARSLVIKRYRYSYFFRRLGFIFLSSPAVRSLKGALLLKRDGIDTADPLAALEHRRWGHLGTSYSVAEEVQGSQSLPVYWKDGLANYSSEKVLRRRQPVLRKVASLFHQLHSRGIYHRDLKGSNILIRKWDTGKWECFLVDVDRVRKSRRLCWSKKVKNLVQLHRSLGRRFSNRDKIFFLKLYADLSLLSRKNRKALARTILAAS